MPDRYDHKQLCPLALWVLGIGIAWCGVISGLGLAGQPVDHTSVMISFLAAGFGMVYAALFAYMHVREEGPGLRIEYGPLDLVHAEYGYALMESVGLTTVRHLRRWQVRWGGPIRVYAARRGPAVRVNLRQPPGTHLPRALVIGTDEPERLAAFLQDRIAETALTDRL
jgi:hypothetical protein